MRFLGLLAALLFSLTSLSSAQLNDPGFLVISGFSNQELLFHSQEIQQTQHVSDLGTTANVVRVFGERVFVVHSGDFMTGEGAEVWYTTMQELSDAVLETREPNWTVLPFPDFSNPWDIHVEENTAFVSLTGSGSVEAVDLWNHDPVHSFTGLDSPQGLACNGDWIAAAESGFGSGTWVNFINMDDYTELVRMGTPRNPVAVTADNTGRFHVLCSGASWTFPPAPAHLKRYSSSLAVEETIELTDYPGAIAMLTDPDNGEQRVVVGDEYAVSGQPLQAFDAMDYTPDETVPDWSTGWTLAPTPTGLALGSTTTYGLILCDSDWQPYEGYPVTMTEAVVGLAYADFSDFVVPDDASIAAIPSSIVLEPAYPNPFNSSSRLAFRLPIGGMTRLTIHNLTGRRVATIVQGDFHAGRHEVTFQAAGLASGRYFAVLYAGGSREVTPLTLVR
ncbi:hypothetical protein GF324_06130 [bacterium]|nr:hypothetical protein [bacterium]